MALTKARLLKHDFPVHGIYFDSYLKFSEFQIGFSQFSLSGPHMSTIFRSTFVIISKFPEGLRRTN